MTRHFRPSSMPRVLTYNSVIVAFNTSNTSYCDWFSATLKVPSGTVKFLLPGTNKDVLKDAFLLKDFMCIVSLSTRTAHKSKASY